MFDIRNNGAFDLSNDLRKALQAGAITGRDTANQSLGVEPTKFEDLTETVKSLEVRKKDIVMKSLISTIPAYDTVAQWIQQESYGDRDSGFISEGEDVGFSDNQFNRRAELHKYVAYAGEATIQASAVKTVLGNVNQKRVNDLLMQMLIKLNKTLWHGDARINPKEFNGVLAQHGKIGSDPSDYYNTIDSYFNSPVVIDMRGKSMTFDELEEASVVIDENYGDFTSLITTPSVISGLTKEYQTRNRNIPGITNNGVLDVALSGIMTSMGLVNLHRDKFATRGKDVQNGAVITLSGTTASPSSKTPDNPVPDVTTPVDVVVDAKSQFVAGGTHTDVLGDVYYAVRAINTYGWSAPVLLDSTAATLAAGSSVNLKFTAAGTGTAATGFMVYRTKATTSVAPAADSVPFYPLFKISAADLAAGYDGAAALSVRDRNRILPDCQDAIAGSLGEDVVGYHELIPISKYDIARTASLTDKYAVVSVSTPVLYAPKKLVKFINIGPYVAS